MITDVNIQKLCDWVKERADLEQQLSAAKAESENLKSDKCALTVQLEGSRMCADAFKNECDSLRAKLAEAEIPLLTLKLWLDQCLNDLKYRNTSPAGSPNQANGYAYAEIADWELRQKQEVIDTLRKQIGVE